MLQLKITTHPSFKIFSSLSFILYDVRSIFLSILSFSSIHALFFPS